MNLLLTAAALLTAASPAALSAQNRQPGPVPNSPAQQTPTMTGERAGVVAAGHNILMVHANPVAGQEQQFETWYEGHIKTILTLPGMVRAQRFKMAPRTGRPNPAWGYVVIYEFTGSQDALMTALGAAAKAGTVELPDKRFVLKTEASTWTAQGPGQTSGK